MNILGYFLAILLILLGLIITSLNTESIQFHYYVASCKLPLSLLLILSFGAGAFLGLCVNFMRHIKQKNALKQWQQNYQKLEKEISRLRTLETQTSLHRPYALDQRDK